MQVKSRFSIMRIWLPLAVFVILFLIGLWLGFTADNRPPGQRDKWPQLQWPALVFCFTAIAGAIITIFKAKRITIGVDEITIQAGISKKVIIKNDISGIDVFARGGAGFFSLYQKMTLNGTRIFIQDNEPVFIPDLYYENVLAIKQAIKTNFPGLVTLPERKSNSRNTATAIPETFTGNPWVTWQTGQSILFAAFIIAITVMLIIKHAVLPFYLLPAILIPFLFAMAGNQMHYFIVDGAQLTIKNYVWWWRTITYDVDDITEAVAERIYSSLAPNMLTLTFNNNSTKSFRAAPLRRNTWTALLQRLAAFGIVTKDEVF